MAALGGIYDGYENDIYCATATNKEVTDMIFSIHLYSTIGAPDTLQYTIDGLAYRTDSENPGSFEVEFDSESNDPIILPYVVRFLGPINVHNMYDWAIITDNNTSSLILLVRDNQIFDELYRDQVTDILNALGFVGDRTPFDIHHGGDCIYEHIIAMYQIPDILK
jgi:lipocalin